MSLNCKCGTQQDLHSALADTVACAWLVRVQGWSVTSEAAAAQATKEAAMAAEPAAAAGPRRTPPQGKKRQWDDRNDRGAFRIVSGNII